jgi:antitoxin MazE
MKVQIKEQDGLLSLPLPSSVTSKVKMVAGSVVDISIDKGTLIVAPVSNQISYLDALLEGITAENLHSEFDFGSPVGNEAW